MLVSPRLIAVYIVARKEQIDLSKDVKDKIDVKMVSERNDNFEFYDKCRRDKKYWCRSSFDAKTNRVSIFVVAKKATASDPLRGKGSMPPSLTELLELSTRECAQEEKAKEKAEAAAAEAQNSFEQESQLVHAFQDLKDKSARAPFRPENLEAHLVLGDTTSVKLSWTPADGNGSKVTKYFVQKRRQGDEDWEDVGTCSKPEKEVKGLDPEETYMFRVRAQNKVGTGPVSDSTPPFSSADAEAAPGKKRKSGAGNKDAKKKAKTELDSLVSVPIEIDDEEGGWELAVIVVRQGDVANLSVHGEGLRKGVNVAIDINYRVLEDKTRLVGKRVVIKMEDLQGTPEVVATVQGYRPTTDKHEVLLADSAEGGKKRVYHLADTTWRYA